MRVKVMKFGGTSVASSESRATAALKVIQAKEQGFRPVVVISAIGRKGAPYATDTLINLLREIDPKVEPDSRELDLIMACGEILSSVIFAHTLKTFGHPAQAFRGGQAGIRTDGVYGDARIVSIEPALIHRSITQGYIPVICGFQGVYIEPGMPGGELTTLGRGGSDTTASAMGAALKADCVEIFTDVDGVKTADPDSVPKAPTLRRVSYDEVAEIAHLGANVLHPRAAEIAMNHNIPLWVKNTFSDHVGTEIIPRGDFEGREVTGIAHTGKLVHLSFDLSTINEAHRDPLKAELYSILAKNNVNLFMVNLSADQTSFAVTRQQFPLLRDLLDGLAMPLDQEGKPEFGLIQIGEPSNVFETQLQMLGRVGPTVPVKADINEGCTIVSLVGREYLAKAGAFLRVLETLAKNQISVVQTTDSAYSFSCLIPEAECNRAVRLLHEELGLNDLS